MQRDVLWKEIILTLLSNKYKGEEINAMLVFKIESEMNEIYKEVYEKYSEEKSTNSSFVSPSFI